MSGVGKSSIANWLLGSAALATGSIRTRDERGMHTTSHRSLSILPDGGVLIDTPGMRELGIWREESSLAEASPEIVALARECRFGDCSHGSEPGCAVRAAHDAGTLSAQGLTHLRQLRGELLERSTATQGKPRGARRKGRV
jgi:ribosome biogenesis GTPase